MAKLAYGNYGHHGSGKQYVYWVGDSYRTGQNVVAPVTDPVTGRTYRTMFTIRRTTGEDTQRAKAEEARLNAQGIQVKAIDGRDVLSLPGGKDYSSAAQWKRESDERYNRLLQDRSRYGRANSVYRQGWDETRAIFMRRFRI